LRAVSSNGSVDLLPATVPAVLAAIKTRGGKVTRTQLVTLQAPKINAGSQAVCDAAALAHMVWGLRNQPAIHYSELLSGPENRAMWLQNPSILPQWTDCSGWCVETHKVGGLEDPAGQKYAGVGNSTEICTHLQRVQEHQLQPVDIVTFGVGGSEHAALVYDVSEAGITLCSHGQEAGPLLVTLESECAAHGNGPMQFLRRGVPVAA
jgi:hypothetical protein